MGGLALRHRVVRYGLPPDDVLEPMIERTDNHWYWLGEFTDDPFDRAPVVFWSPPGVSIMRFSVVQLLCERADEAWRGRHATFVNACGVYACINPAHWIARLLVGQSKRVFVPSGQGVHPVRTLQDVVSIHIAHADTMSALCGTRCGVPVQSNEIITCQECVRTWRAQGGKVEVVF